jgi:putative acetyltransferase
VSDVSVAAEPARGAGVEALLRALDADLRSRYPATSVHGLDLDELDGGKGAFVVARIGGEAVGCGAVRALGPGVGEVKRMFVLRERRGRGIARRVLAALEVEALALGFSVLRLETGSRQPEALGLYESSGYARIPAFGEYATDPWSVCMEKRLR